MCEMDQGFVVQVLSLPEMCYQLPLTYKLLVCADFRSQPHTNRTHFGSVRRTHPNLSFCARRRTCNLTFFLKEYPKKINWLKILKIMLLMKNGLADEHA